MIFDCFTFFNELDILDIRLEELSPVVDKFVIVEADLTFQGNPKPFYFEQERQTNPKRYAKFRNKIINHHVYFPRFIDGAWDREYHQRNAIGSAVAPLAKPNDIIMVSDADEIPRRQSVASLDPQPIQSVALDVFYYGLNVHSTDEHTMRAVRWSDFTTAQQVRTTIPIDPIQHGGWHFSYLGDPNHIATKFQSFAHKELNRPDTTNPDVLRARMDAVVDLWGDGHQYEVVPVDDTWPELVKANPERFKDRIWKSA
jgi:hypothetical protein